MTRILREWETLVFGLSALDFESAVKGVRLAGVKTRGKERGEERRTDDR